MPSIGIISLVKRFEAPIPWERVLWLEDQLANHVLREARREGVPAGHVVSFSQVEVSKESDAAQALALCRPHDAAVLLMPADADLGRAMSQHVGREGHLLLHQNLDPAAVPESRSLRLGIGTRTEKCRVAAGLIQAKGSPGAVLVSAQSASGTALDGRVIVVPGPASPDAAAAWCVEVLGPHPSALVLLECGGPINRAIARALAGTRNVVFLNGNPDPSDPLGSKGVLEIVGNLPDRIGGALAAAVAEVTGGAPSREDLDTAGMFAWRTDAVRLIISSADRLRTDRVAPAGGGSLAARLHEQILRNDGNRRLFHGWHRPMWFDKEGSNLCTEVVVAHVDPLTSRRVTSDDQFAQGPAGDAVAVPVLGVDVDFVSISAIEEDKGTFYAEVIVRVDVSLSGETESPQSCLRVLNAAEDKVTWLEPRHEGGNVVSQVLRGTFRFAADLMLYPMDQQLLRVQLCATGGCTGHVLRPIPTCCDIDCQIVGWRVVGAHRGVSYQVRSAACGTPEAVQGIEYGIRVSRARRDVALRVAIPLGLLTLVAAATMVSSRRGSVDVTAGLLGSVFLTAVALYFSEPKPAIGERTLVDAVYLRAFGLFAFLLVAALTATLFDDDAYRAVCLTLAACILPAWAALLVSVRGMVGPARWRLLRQRWS